ncbi:hypothetical protein Tco_1309054, partial [Tanacetum coccineum]
GSGPHKGGGSRLNISAIGGNFARIRSPILVHPGGYMPITERQLVRNLQGFSEVLYAQEVKNYVKEDHALIKKVLDAAEAYTKNSTNLTKLLQLVKKFDFLGFKTTIDSLQDTMTAQNDHLAKWAESFALIAWGVGPRMTRIENTQANIQSDIATLKAETSEIKAMMTEIFSHTTTINPTKENLSQTEGEKDDMITEELVSKTDDVEKEPEQEPQDTKPIPITIVRPTITPIETEIIRSSSRPQLIDPIVEVKVSQPKSSSHTTPKPDRGKGIARDTNESPRKLVNASTKVHPDPDTLVLIPYKIYGKLYQLTSEQIQAHLDKEEDCQRSKAIRNE